MDSSQNDVLLIKRHSSVYAGKLMNYNPVDYVTFHSISDLLQNLARNSEVTR